MRERTGSLLDKQVAQHVPGNLKYFRLSRSRLQRHTGQHAACHLDTADRQATPYHGQVPISDKA